MLDQWDGNSSKVWFEESGNVERLVIDRMVEGEPYNRWEALRVWTETGSREGGECLVLEDDSTGG